MTCICGYIDPVGNIFMGGDAIGVIGSNYMIVKDPKVFVRRNMIFGFCTSFRMGDILKYDFEIPDHPKGMSTLNYLTSVFLVKLLNRYEERKFLTISDNVAIGGIFLLGYDKRLFRIESDLCIIEDIKNYDAAGCGQDFAKASMFLLEKSNLSPIEKIEESLRVASEFSFVRPPYKVLALPCIAGLNIGIKKPRKKKKPKKS
jgi:hypothetical protein